MNIDQARKRIEELSLQIEEHNRRYYILSAPTISDFDFISCLDMLKIINLRVK